MLHISNYSWKSRSGVEVAKGVTAAKFFEYTRERVLRPVKAWADAAATVKEAMTRTLFAR